MRDYDKLIFEISKEGRKAYDLPKLDTEGLKAEDLIPNNLLRKEDLDLPEVSEVDVVRHYTALSTKNYGVDTGFYPLGSCTMKYNPKINEDMASLPGFAKIHPLQSESTVQGALELMFNLESKLCEITGMKEFTLQPAAGAHGELTGIMLIKAYHESRGDIKRRKIIVPDSAHGTNPATASMLGFDVVEVKSTVQGDVDLDSLKSLLGDDIAGLMLTNPSTLGLFDRNILEVSRLVHESGGLLYYDGANMNAIMGIARPGDMGFDVIHLNLHKTFSTPHGGGGPGSGPVGVVEALVPFLPAPKVCKEGEKYYLCYKNQESIGKIKSFYGNFGILVRAYTYILSMGRDGLKNASEMAVLHANYIKEKLKAHYNLPIDRVCMHEFVLGEFGHSFSGVTTLDIAKRLLDYGFHPPTIYFPLIVEGAMMIEPTETESLETIDSFIDAMLKIRQEIISDPDLVKKAPYSTRVRRLDEVKAARSPKLRWSRG